MSHQLARDRNGSGKGPRPSLRGHGDGSGCWGTANPCRSLPPRPPNARTWCDAAVPFRRSRRVLQLSASSLAAAQPPGRQQESASFGGGWTPSAPIHLLAWGVGQIGGWVLLATAAGDLGAIVPRDRITLALNPSLKGDEREVGHSPACSSADSPLGRDSGSWGDTAVPCPQQRGTSGDLRMRMQPPPASLWEVMSRMLLCGCLTPWSLSVWRGCLSFCTLRCVAGRLEEPLEAVTAPDPTQPCAGCN